MSLPKAAKVEFAPTTSLGDGSFHKAAAIPYFLGSLGVKKPNLAFLLPSLSPQGDTAKRTSKEAEQRAGAGQGASLRSRAVLTGWTHSRAQPFLSLGDSHFCSSSGTIL